MHMYADVFPFMQIMKKIAWSFFLKHIFHKIAPESKRKWCFFLSKLSKYDIKYSERALYRAHFRSFFIKWIVDFEHLLFWKHVYISWNNENIHNFRPPKKQWKMLIFSQPLKNDVKYIARIRPRAHENIPGGKLD